MPAFQITSARATRSVAAGAARPRHTAATARPTAAAPVRRGLAGASPAFAPLREAVESYQHAADMLCEVTYSDDDMLSGRDARVAAAYPHIFVTDDVPCHLTYSEDDETD